MMFALAIIPVLGMVGAAVDYSQASRQKAKLQGALDSATLAATRDLTANSSPEQIKAAIAKTLAAHLNSTTGLTLNVTYDQNQRRVLATASQPQKTYILPVIGISQIPVGATSHSQLGRPYVEVALVLDNSGSMAGQRIEAVRTSAQNLTTKVLDMAYIQGDTRVALVPFSGMVNIGAGNANQAWMDTLGLSPIHSENFSPAGNRFTLYSLMRNVSWGGCVEARPQPHDVTDSTPTVANPATLFVPGFAPDEPDDNNSFYNDYLSDTGGLCLSLGKNAPLSERQRRICKYTGANPDQSLANGTRRGPNQMCDSRPIVPLTSNRGTLTSNITAMTAYGGTNIHEGVMWGWRVLSPGAPFTEGRPYEDLENRKVIVLMTDGSNDHIGLNNMNNSFYSAYGYSVAGRLGTTSSTKAQLIAKMNERTLLACTNAKAAGMTIYTVAWFVQDQTTRDLLAQCASRADMAIVADSLEALNQAFNHIAGSISRLRLVN
ncbi:pilus assembly protein TadG-related protein [Phreatobacter sp.]|uniref:pilus assembly protein TadG-related protein n=1 Tax=Phreatobacter sp. TaxID=1966341 RepID=UPI003F6E5D61